MKIGVKEVLEGKAVFVYDTVFNDDHKGETTGDADAAREVDFVQELLNQVVPRNRRVFKTDLNYSGLNFLEKKINLQSGKILVIISN